MTDSELQQAIRAYAAGLEAELTLLGQLERLAAEQQSATRASDADRLTRIAEERERLMANLVAIEHEIRPIRQLLSTHRDEASQLPGFADVALLHRTAGNLVTTIVASDRQTLEALREAEAARRLAVQAVEAGETTLAAYRRVIAPPPTNASLVDRRG